MKTNDQNQNQDKQPNQNQGQTPQTNPQAPDNSKRPQNKDNLDSREGEEQDTKGDDVTHNKKEQQSENKDNK